MEYSVYPCLFWQSQLVVDFSSALLNLKQSDSYMIQLFAQSLRAQVFC